MRRAVLAVTALMAAAAPAFAAASLDRGTIAATDDAVYAIIPPATHGIAALIDGYFSGTLIPEFSADNGRTWVALSIAPITAPGLIVAPLDPPTAQLYVYRLRGAAWGGGSARVWIDYW